MRIALELKGLDYTYVPHHLRHGEHLEAPYLAVNPQGLVPALIWTNGTMLLAVAGDHRISGREYPEPPLLPPTRWGARACACWRR